MKLYKFVNRRTKKVALTADKSGANLPGGSKEWQAMGERNINAEDGPMIGAHSREIIEGVERDGYVISGDKPDD